MPFNSSLKLRAVETKLKSVFWAFNPGVLLIIGVLMVGSFLFPRPVKATAPVLNIAPGQVARIVIYYDNSSTTNDFVGQGKLQVAIDPRLEYIEGYLKDTYALDSRCVNDSASFGIVTKATIQGQSNATLIDYTPKTATTAASTGVCSVGSGSKGNTVSTTLPKATSSFSPSNVSTWRGRLEFRVRLKSDILTTTNLKIGDVIEPNAATSNIGIYGEFSLNGILIGTPQYAIKISGVSISQEVIVSAQCIGQPILIGENAQCGLRLTGGNNTTNPYILPEDFRVQIAGSSGFADKNSCQLDNANGILSCLVPTVNAASGDDVPVNVTLSGKTRPKTTVKLISDFDPKGDFDKDGISNEIECGFSSGRNCRDTDKDGTLDYKDGDSDNDGIPDLIEAKCSAGVGSGFPCDSDEDKIPDYLDTDADNDNRPDSEEKGALKCDMTKIPVTCENELRDTDNDGIPNFRDKDDGSLDIRYLIKDENIKFSFVNQSKPIWRVADIVVDVEIDRNVVDCEVRFRKYSSTDWWISGEATINSNKCQVVLRSDKQYTQNWDTLIVLTDNNGEKWGAYPSFAMENGSVGGTVIEGKVLDGIRT